MIHGIDHIELIVRNVDEFVKMFESAEFKVDQIELWIEGETQANGVTNLIISSEGAGGCKVVLRPKKENSTTS